MDVVFDTAADVEQSSEAVPEESIGIATSGDVISRLPERTSPSDIDAVRDRIVQALQKKLGVTLIRRRRAMFEDIEGHNRACVSISKRYGREYQPYWYAYHPAWNEFLEGAKDALFVLGCMDRDEAFAIPLSIFATFLPKLNRTIKRGRRELLARSHNDQ